jgi:hypothetical protein
MLACGAVFFVHRVAFTGNVEATPRIDDIAAHHKRHAAQIVPFATALGLRYRGKNSLRFAHSVGVDVNSDGNVSVIARG